METKGETIPWACGDQDRLLRGSNRRSGFDKLVEVYKVDKRIWDYFGATSKTFPFGEVKQFNCSTEIKFQKASSLWFFAILFIECGTDIKDNFKSRKLKK